jgi:hypothetical protein
MIKIPEIELVSIIKKMLKGLEADYDAATDKSTTILANMYEGMVYENTDMYDGAIDLFVNNQKRTAGASNRKIEVSSYYDRRIRQTPAIHITAPSEEDYMNAFASGFGEANNVFDDPNFTVRETRCRRTQAIHAIVFTSDNHLEVQLLYFTIKFLLISYLDELSLGWFQDPKLSGNQLKLDDGLKAPEHFYVRALMIQSFSDTEVINAFTSPTYSDIVFPRTNDEVLGGHIADQDPTLTINTS